jgi:hypothetical protein
LYKALLEGLNALSGDKVLEIELDEQGFTGSKVDKQRLIAFLQAEVFAAAAELGLILDDLPNEEYQLRGLLDTLLKYHKPYRVKRASRLSKFAKKNNVQTFGFALLMTSSIIMSIIMMNVLRRSLYYQNTFIPPKTPTQQNDDEEPKPPSGPSF